MFHVIYRLIVVYEQVDVTAAFRGEVTPTQFCDERSMVLVLDEAQREATLLAMAAKREQAAELFGAP